MNKIDQHHLFRSLEDYEYEYEYDVDMNLEMNLEVCKLSSFKSLILHFSIFIIPTTSL